LQDSGFRKPFFGRGLEVFRIQEAGAAGGKERLAGLQSRSRTRGLLVSGSQRCRGREEPKKGPRRGASGGAGEGACTAARPAVLHRLHLRAGAVAAGRRRRWARGASGGVGDSSRDTTGKPTGDRVVAARLGFGVGWAPLCGATGVRVGFVGCLGSGLQVQKCAMSKHIWAGLYFG